MNFEQFLSDLKKNNPNNSILESITEGFSSLFESRMELISLGDMKSRVEGDESKRDSWDTTQCQKFKAAWNTKYPNYPVGIYGNPHDYGRYYDIQINDELFDKSFDDLETFPDGIETAAGNLAEELGLDS